MFEMRPYRRNSMSTWNPFSEMEEMERRLFNNDFFSGRGLAEFKTDIPDEGDYYELKADLPGFKKEDIQLQLDGDTLTIQAQRHSEHEEQEKKGKYVCCERSYGAYSRSFDVSGIRAEGITASYDSGVLTLKLPKKTVTKIKAGKDPRCTPRVLFLCLSFRRQKRPEEIPASLRFSRVSSAPLPVTEGVLLWQIYQVRGTVRDGCQV